MFDRNRIDEIKTLEERLKRLKGSAHGRSTSPGSRSTVTPPTKHKVARKRIQTTAPRRNPRVILPGNYALTTIPGSLYSTLLLVIGALGKLDVQEALFAEFAKQNDLRSARELLNKIGVSRSQMDRGIRGHGAFKAYAAAKTIRLNNKAATGDKNAHKVLNNPKMCSAKGRWIGDIDEAVNILRGARNEHGLKSLKNVGILRRARAGKNIGLMFDTSWRTSEQHCYLYPRKFHVAFRRARALAGE